MIHHRWEMLLIVWAAASTLQALLFVIQRQTRDATAVDAGRGFSLAAAAILAAVPGPGDGSHRLLIGILGAAENARVAILVVRRFGHGEDGLYASAGQRRVASS